MSSLQNVRIAIRALGTNKLRAVLTMLGVIIGVASVIALVAVGDGAQARVQSQVAALGTNLLQVIAFPPRLSGVAQAQAASANLTLDDLSTLAALPSLAAVAPEMSRGFQLTYQRQNSSAQVIGTTAAYARIRDATVAEGRFISSADQASGAQVAVLGATQATNLFGNEDPLGKTMQINTTTVTGSGSSLGAAITPVNFRVIGLLAAKGVGFDSPDDNVYVPVSTAQWRLIGSANLRWIDAGAVSTAQMSTASAEIVATLNRTHGIKDPSQSPYIVRNQADILSAATGVTQTFTLLLSAIAAISLVVGGIGIMNIMMVSVTERTREIGIRKALGATRGLILQQFLVEAVTLSVLGGALGIASGAGVARALSNVVGWSAVISLKATALAFSCAFVMGLIFGVYPAWRAARLDPIEALRYE
ncbi:MAG TPA: ABC transporter permease [Chloroflexota bacterium]|nr:ABC transporter permease [Chloroflexota bacterium]